MDGLVKAGTHYRPGAAGLLRVIVTVTRTSSNDGAIQVARRAAVELLHCLLEEHWQAGWPSDSEYTAAAQGSWGGLLPGRPKGRV